MDPSDSNPSTVLRSLVNGYQVSQAIHVAATLGIADLLRDGQRGSDELAASTGADEQSLYRVLRALASVGVFHEEPERRFALTPLGECLCSDAPEPVDGWAAFIGQPYHWQAWGDLLHSVRTGENAFHHVHGMDSWEYRERHPELSRAFDYAMLTNTRRVTASILAAYDFGRFSHVVDIGGGRGAFLAAMLSRNLDLQGVLFDQPHVVVGAEPVLQTAGVLDRCRVAGGDFFSAVPAGGDAYVLKSVLHDWEDEPATAILRACRQSITVGGTLFVIERLIGPLNEGAEGKFSDLTMLVGAGGQERTQDEFATLLAAAGFRFVTAVSAGEFSIIKGVPV